MAVVFVIMGVSGCGKTTIGKGLADQLGIPFYDADDFHPQHNIDKMGSGIPLEDDDRWSWLAHLSTEVSIWSAGRGGVLACSALKEVYRERLYADSDAYLKAKKNFIYLDASYDIIKERLAKRRNHFFDPSLLQSQFDTLEIPSYGIHIDITQPRKNIIRQIIQIIQD